MAELVFFLLVVAAIFALAMNKAPIWAWAALVVLTTFFLSTGLYAGRYEPAGFGLLTLIGWLPAAIMIALSFDPLRQRFIIEPAFRTVRGILPKVSATEQEALDAGTVGWDAELFSGSPDWSKLKAVRPLTLSEEERAFLDGPTEELCAMVDDWKIRQEERTIPQEIWTFVRENGFLGMLISKEHGGLGFSPQAQSLILGKIASRSPDVCIIVMVPNSLGPGELIEKYGTPEQKARFLPRLARGEEIPCFALTGPNSGSDAAAMRDIGTVCKGMHDGQEVTGIKVSWDKRYITLAPNATLLGLAFQLFDPENLLGKGEDIGITLALIPTNHPGVNIGRRHLPCGAAFPNGPTSGTDVFIPLEWVIGGEARAGQGWRMLMSCLSAGRSISLPASSTAACKSVLRTTSAYARIRKQFGIAIGRMEGVEEALARIVEQAYVTESGRAVTASMVGAGEKPAVISALLKYQTTIRMRAAVNDAMDIHGGRAICDGPANYLQGAYQLVPVGITVEGANILTRTLITFAQGALRSHPWLYREIQALQDPDQDRGLLAFEDAFSSHVRFSLANVFGAFLHNATFGIFANAPDHARETLDWYKRLTRASRSFALASDLAVITLGGRLKLKQKICGRLADALSELYLLSCLLKRYEDDDEPESDRAILDYCAQNCLYRFQEAIRGVVDNFPIRPVRWMMRVILFPWGAHARPASDDQAKKIVKLVLEPGVVRDRLTRDIYINEDANDVSGILEVTLQKVVATEDLMKKVDRAVREGFVRRYHGFDWIAEAETKKILTAEEARRLREADALVEKVIGVDHFDPAEIVPHHSGLGTDKATQYGAAAE